MHHTNKQPINHNQLIEKILDYLNKYLDTNFAHSAQKFEKETIDTTFTCRPPYTYLDSEGELKSILHIHTVPQINQEDTSAPYLSQVLQTLFNIFVCNVEFGYLCLFKSSQKSSINAEFVNELILDSRNPQDIQKQLPIKLGNTCLELKYQVSEVWKNSFKSNFHIVLLKIRPEQGNWQYIINHINGWCQEHQNISPLPTKQEKRKIKKWLKKHDIK